MKVKLKKRHLKTLKSWYLAHIVYTGETPSNADTEVAERLGIKIQ